MSPARPGRWRRRELAIALVALVVAGAPAGPPAASAAVPPGSGSAPAMAAGGSPADWEAGQWWLRNAKIRERHAAGLTGKGVNIALINGPVFTGIPELQGQRVLPSWTACDRPGDERKGPTTAGSKQLGDLPFHTTSMAALVVGNGRGTGPGGAGILGVAPDATLRTYAFFNSLDPDQKLACHPDRDGEAIDRAVADGANIIFIPMHFDGADVLQAAINRAVVKGVVVLSAAGNDGPQNVVGRPGDMRGVLVIGSLDRDGGTSALNPTSNSSELNTAGGTFDIHALAPGMDILGGAVVGGQWESNRLQRGSSAACAIVAGQLALMKQKWPTATGNQLLYSLLRNTNRDPNGPVWTPRAGFGTTSFEKTLAVDPAQYPDVHPFYGRLSDVVNDNPAKPFIPTELDAKGELPQAPVPAVPRATSATSPASSAPAATSVTAPSTPPSTAPVTPPVNAGGPPSGSSTSSPVRWVAAVLLLLGVLAGLAVLVRNRRRAITI